MKILLVHNEYVQAGGEDAVFQQEKRMLENAGHEVVVYHRSNRETESMSAIGKATVPFAMIWSTGAVADLKALIRQHKPDLAHFINTHYRVSPGAYYACSALGVPVVQTVQNFRLFCLDASFMRDGHVCEDCRGKLVPYPGLQHRCYHGSTAHSASVAAMLTIHRLLGTWQRKVDTFVAATEFSRQKFIENGLPPEKIVVKPNFLDPVPEPKQGDGAYGLFVGRLSPVKGLRPLIEAARRTPDIPLKVVGDGPEMAWMQEAIRSDDLQQVELLGWRASSDVLGLMRQARFLVFPSLWYEGFPVTILESFASALPVIASRLGSMAELVSDRQTGLHFTPGDAAGLAENMRYAWENPAIMTAMGQQARAEFLDKYTAEKNLQLLMAIYEQTIARARRK